MSHTEHPARSVHATHDDGLHLDLGLSALVKARELAKGLNVSNPESVNAGLTRGHVKACASHTFFLIFRAQ